MGETRKPSMLIDDRSQLGLPTTRPSTPIFQYSGYLRKTTSKLFRIKSREQTTTSQLYEEPTPTVRRTPSNSSWALKSNQLLNRLRKKQSSTESLAAPSETCTTTAKPAILQSTKLRFKTNKHSPPTSKSLSNINLTWLQSQQREPASCLSTPTTSPVPARSNTIHSLPRVHNLTPTPSSAPSQIVAPNDERGSMMHARPRVQHSRQTIYMPIEYQPSLSRPTLRPVGQPAAIPAMRHKRYSPTEIALSQLDEILRGGVSSSSSSSSNNNNNNSNSSSSSKSFQPVQSSAIACSTMPIMPSLYTLSPPHRPSRGKPALLDARHRRTHSSSLAKANNPFPPPVAPTNPYKVPLQSHAWQAISISAASYHRLHQHPPPPHATPLNVHHIGNHHLDNFELVSPDRPPFVPSSSSSSSSSGDNDDHSSTVSVSSSSDHTQASADDQNNNTHCSRGNLSILPPSRHTNVLSAPLSA